MENTHSTNDDVNVTVADNPNVTADNPPPKDNVSVTYNGTDYWFREIFSRLTNGETQRPSHQGKLGFLFLGVFMLPHHRVKNRAFPGKKARAECTLQMISDGLQVLRSLPKEEADSVLIQRIDACQNALLTHYTRKGRPLYDYNSKTFRSYVFKTDSYQNAEYYLEFFSCIQQRPELDMILQELAAFYDLLLEYLWQGEMKSWKHICEVALSGEPRLYNKLEHRNGYYLMLYLLNAALLGVQKKSSQPKKASQSKKAAQSENAAQPEKAPQTEKASQPKKDLQPEMQNLVLQIRKRILDVIDELTPVNVKVPADVFWDMMNMIWCDCTDETAQKLCQWIPEYPADVKLQLHEKIELEATQIEDHLKSGNAGDQFKAYMNRYVMLQNLLAATTKKSRRHRSES